MYRGKINISVDVLISLIYFEDLIESVVEDDFIKVKTFYESCADEARVRERADRPVIQFFKDTFPAALHPVAGDQGDLTYIITGNTFL